LIELKNIKKSYDGEKVIVNDLNLKINSGELVVLIGESGCGKTTTMKMINRLIEPDSGEILIDGKNIEEIKKTDLRKNIGYVIQQVGLLPHLTISQNIALIPKMVKKNPEDILNKTMELMELVDLSYEDYKDRYPKELSGGQQQRVGVARALANDPDIILMDEPFSALDPITRQQLQIELLKLQDTLHKTIVFVTHDIDEAFKLGDRIAIMKDGVIIQYDIPEEILKNPKDEFIESFIGKNRLWRTPDLLRASDVMDKKFAKIGASRSISHAVEVSKERDAKVLVVVEKSQESKNVFKGLVRASSLKKAANNAKMSELMKTDIQCVNENECLVNVLNIRKETNNRYTPVIDDQGYLQGMITDISILNVVSDIIPEIEEY
jgi:osmoprotectant transport system ATP-binding protein